MMTEMIVKQIRQIMIMTTLLPPLQTIIQPITLKHLMPLLMETLTVATVQIQITPQVLVLLIHNKARAHHLAQPQLLATLLQAVMPTQRLETNLTS